GTERAERLDRAHPRRRQRDQRAPEMRRSPMEETKDQPDPTPPAEWVPLASLVPFEGNPRRNDKTVPIVAASIRRFGWGAPMVARLANRVILAGHARRGAALLLAEQWAKATSRERQTWHPDAVRVATKGEVDVRFTDTDE